MPPLEVKRINVTVYGLCVLRRWTRQVPLDCLDVLLVGDRTGSCTPAPGHSPEIVYGPTPASEPMVCMLLDLSDIASKEKPENHDPNDELVDLHAITKTTLQLDPAKIPNVVGCVRLPTGKPKAHTGPGPKEWTLQPKLSTTVLKKWPKLCWKFTWDITLQQPATLPFERSLLNLKSGQLVKKIVLDPDPSGAVSLNIANIIPTGWPPVVGKEPEGNKYAPHFRMYNHLYPGHTSWPDLVYGGDPSNPPTSMNGAPGHEHLHDHVTTSYTCVPAGGK
jgi:hypothetical protein